MTGSIATPEKSGSPNGSIPEFLRNRIRQWFDFPRNPIRQRITIDIRQQRNGRIIPDNPHHLDHSALPQLLLDRTERRIAHLPVRKASAVKL